MTRRGFFAWLAALAWWRRPPARAIYEAPKLTSLGRLENGRWSWVDPATAGGDHMAAFQVLNTALPQHAGIPRFSVLDIEGTAPSIP